MPTLTIALLRCTLSALLVVAPAAIVLLLPSVSWDSAKAGMKRQLDASASPITVD